LSQGGQFLFNYFTVIFFVTERAVFLASPAFVPVTEQEPFFFAVTLLPETVQVVFVVETHLIDKPLVLLAGSVSDLPTISDVATDEIV
jgi:hypothetical protein